jgi:DNA-binding MarR family transcriptional regulator
VEFPDGPLNAIQWRATDTAGNGPVESEPYIIPVDTEGPVFSDAFPTGKAAFDSTTVEVGITISDVTSGVNAGTIEFSVSTNGGKSWGDWRAISGYDGGTGVTVGLELVFPEGDDNLIRWRAGDVAGNGPAESKSFTIKVSLPAETEPRVPEVVLLAPSDGAVIADTAVELMWEPVGDGAGWTYDVYVGRDETPWQPWAEDLGVTSLSLEGLEDGTTYHWTVVPISEHGVPGRFGDIVWFFSVDIIGEGEPDGGAYGVTLGAVPDMTAQQGENLQLTVQLTNTGSGPDSFALSVDVGGLGTMATIGGPTTVRLEGGETIAVPLLIAVPVSTAPGLFPISFTAASTGAAMDGMDVADSADFTLTVTGRSDAGGAEGSEDKEGGTGGATDPAREAMVPLGLGAAAVAVLTLPWWYVALLFLLAPLLVRLKSGEEEKKWRDKIYATIVSKPGIHFNGIKGWLDISNGTLVYNLEVLEKEERISSRRDGFFKRFYPTETELYKKPPEFMSMEDKIAIIVRDNPGAAQSEIAYLLDDSWAKVHYHVRKMEEAGIITSTPGPDGHPRFHMAEGKVAEEKRREIFGKTLPPAKAEDEMSA